MYSATLVDRNRNHRMMVSEVVVVIMKWMDRRV